MIYIKVPGSTSNLGPGFDSIGMALNLYLELKAEENEKWVFVHQNDMLKPLPTDDRHYIARMCEYFCEQLNVSPITMKVEMSSQIPLARGLGSSASALIASLLLVDHYHDLNLSVHQMVDLLTAVEGHPDNIIPSLIGGLAACCYEDDKCSFIKLPPIDWPLYIAVPYYELKTEDARRVLPEQLEFKDAVAASAISNVLTAALAVKDYELAGEMMMKDRLHEPYRAALIKDFKLIHSLLESSGYCFISGAGPTIFIIVKPGEEYRIKLLQSQLNQISFKKVEVDTVGFVRTELYNKK